MVSHPAYLNVQLSEPETVPALVQEVTDGRLKASSDGNVWTFADASGDCATSVSPDETGAGEPSTTCGGQNVDEAFGDALSEVLYGRDVHHMAEAVFKGLAKAIDQAVQLDPRVEGVPSTKGTL